MLVLRTILQWLFTATMLLVTVLTFVLVVPLVWLLEVRVRRGLPTVLVLTLMLGAGVLVLSGCDTSSVSNVASLRTQDFAAAAPPAPYQAKGDATALGTTARTAGLKLTGAQLALVQGAADKLKVKPQLLAYIVEHELRNMDQGETDRDILGALAGENTSVGLAQIRVSTAREVEKNDTWSLFPSAAVTGSNATERVRRLAADDWNLLYAAGYLALLGERYPADQPLDLAARYTGAQPGSGDVSGELYELIGRALGP